MNQAKIRYNFSAGPAALPQEVLQQVQAELLDYKGMGISLLELSHRAPQFIEIIQSAKQRVRRLLNLSDSHEIFFMQGGARLMFAALPLNLAAADQQLYYVDSGWFSGQAIKEASRFNPVEVLGKDHKKIPALKDLQQLNSGAYLHITGNNTVMGTRWQQFPEPGHLPIIMDATSEFLSRPLPMDRLAMVYGSLQKNLGPAGLVLAVIRKDLLGKTRPRTPLLMDFTEHVQKDSLVNTTNTFALYVCELVLAHYENCGGLSALAEINQRKANMIYQAIDETELYQGFAHPEHRSTMNITFGLKTPALEQAFLSQAAQQGLHGLAGYRAVGGIRASLYNAMPIAGAEALRDFMLEFAANNR